MSAFDLRGLVHSFANARNVRVAREVAPTFEAGLAIAGGWRIFVLPEVFFWPLTPRELDMLPEGVRERGSIKGIVETGLDTGYDTPARGDVFVWQRKTHRVIELMDWRPAACFLEFVGVRQDVDQTTLDAFIFAEGGRG
jgi:hypothetical protein